MLVDGAVVGHEHYEGVVSDAVSLQGRHHVTNNVINFLQGQAFLWLKYLYGIRYVMNIRYVTYQLLAGSQSQWRISMNSCR